VIAGAAGERIRGSLRLRRVQRNVSGGALIALGLASAFSWIAVKVDVATLCAFVLRAK